MNWTFTKPWPDLAIFDDWASDVTIVLKKNEKISASQALKQEFDILLKQNMPGHFDPDLSERLQALDLRRHPPSNNMGGTYPLPPPVFTAW